MAFTDLKLMPADVVATRSEALLGTAIRFVQKAKASDDEATYNHTLTILAPSGRMIEAVSHIQEGNLYEAYRGQRVLVARWVHMDDLHRAMVCDAVTKYEGRRYPWSRLFLHLLGLAKYVHWNVPVCSELTAYGLYVAGARRNWWGVMPDDLADEWRISRHYEIVFEGVIE